MKLSASIVVLGLSIAISASACQLQAGEKNITVDAGKRYQTITGLGAMIYPYAERFDPAKLTEIFVKDCGCSMARMEISPDLCKEAPGDLDAFLADPIEKTIEQMNFKADTITVVGNVIKPMVDAKLDDLKLIATVWSPPKWMKDNNSCVKGGKLRADRRDHFGKYLAAFCKGFEKTFGVPIFALSIQNELLFVEPYNSCVYKPDSTEYHDAALAVAKAFKKYEIKTKLFGPEHMNNDPRGGFFYNGNIKYIKQVAEDPETLNAFIAWSWHGYAADGKTVSSSKKGWSDYVTDLSSYKKEMWMSETSGQDPQWNHSNKNGKPDGALTMGLALHDAFVAGNLNAWTFWSFQDGKKVSTYNMTAQYDTTSKKYNAAKQFFRYIRPGAVRIDASPDEYDMNVCAFIHDAQKTLTIVLTNMEKDEHKVNLAIAAAKVASFKVFRSTESENFQAQPDAAVTGGKVSITVPAESIVTLLGSCGVEAKPDPTPQAKPKPEAAAPTAAAGTAAIDVKPAAAPAPAAPAANDPESLAKGRLAAAKIYVDSDPSKARDLLRKVITEFPDTQAAKDARQTLAKLN